jgi:hypothetical protein
VVVELLKAVAVLAAAAIIGNWFMAELKKSRREKKPWYAVYLTVPGALVLIAIAVLPILAWVMKS